MGSYLPTAGFPTQITVNGIVLSVAWYRWRSHCDVIRTPSFTGGGKMEHVPGMVSGTFSCGGTWNGVFNPFNHGIRAQQRVPITISLFVGSTPVGIATDDDSIVEDFNLEGDAPGSQSYEIALVMDWAFTDFGGGVVGS